MRLLSKRVSDALTLHSKSTKVYQMNLQKKSTYPKTIKIFAKLVVFVYTDIGVEGTAIPLFFPCRPSDTTERHEYKI